MKKIPNVFLKRVIYTYVALCREFWSDLKILRKDIQNASTTPSKSNQL